MISMIDPNHADVKALKNNIDKIRLNIQTFEDAILEEKNQINRNDQMIDMIEAN